MQYMNFFVVVWIVFWGIEVADLAVKVANKYGPKVGWATLFALFVFSLINICASIALVFCAYDKEGITFEILCNISRAYLYFILLELAISLIVFCCHFYL